MSLLIVTSCATRKRCNRLFPPVADTVVVVTTKDSIVVKDTTIYVTLPGEIQIDSVEIPCPEPPAAYVPDTAYAETSLAKAKAWWGYPFVRLELVQKDSTIEFRLENALREAYYWRNEYEKISSVVVETKIPTVYKIALWVVVGMILMLIIRIVRRI